MIRPPPRSTLFPYTPLFRSTAELTLLQQRLEQARRSRRSAVVVVSGEPGIGKTRLLGQFMAARASVCTLHGRGSPLGSDRKSTRLNSRHGYISYAVFCLKKK